MEENTPAQKQPESEPEWGISPNTVVVEISMELFGSRLSNTIRIPLSRLLADPNMPAHVAMAKTLEDYVYVMSQKFCDRMVKK